MGDVWLNVTHDYPRKEDLLADATAMAAHEAGVAAKLEKTAAPVRALLNSIKATIVEDGSGTPLIRAMVPASAIEMLAAQPEVGLLDTDDYPGKPMSCGDTNTCTSWKGTMQLPSAHSLSTGSGERVCVKEGAQPDDYTRVPVTAIASPTGYTETHIRGTAGTIKNTDATSAPYNCVAPDSSLYIANWGNFTGTGGVDKWCRDNVARYTNFSWSWSDGSAGGQNSFDRSRDWLAKNSPFILFVAASGDNPVCPNCVVMNRGYNGLVVGGMNDKETTDTSDDDWAGNTGWKNFTTTHYDYELPHVVANAYGQSVTQNLTINASSGAAPMVTGVAALVGARDTATFNPWPEMKRAVVIATATQRMNLGAFSNLPLNSDGPDGVGAIDAYKAADLASNAYYIAPNTTSAWKGRYALTLNFANDFDINGWGSKRWRAHISTTGRLRVVFAWDASPSNCDTYGQGCTSSAPDGDIDLYVWSTSSSGFAIPTGAATCTSYAYDSTYEVCEFAVTAGADYLIVPKKISNNTSTTYFGVAWYNY